MRKDRHIKTYLFFFFLTIYLLSAGDHFTEQYYSSDERIMMFTTCALMEKGSLFIRETYGQNVSKYGITQSVAAIPMYILGRTAAGFFPLVKRDYVLIYFFYFTNAVITSLLIVCFYSLSRFLRYQPKTAFYASMVLGLCTICFPYAKTFFSEPLAALLLLASLYYLMSYDRHLRRKDIFLSGVLFALLLLTRVDNLPILLVYIFALVLISLRKGRGTLRLIADVVLFLMPCFLALLGEVFLNYIRYGSLFRTGYGEEGFTTPLLFGLYGLLFSPARSFFFYSPPIILALLCIGRVWKRLPVFSMTVLFIILVKLYFYAKWWSWHGGLGWGSRFLLPLVPPLMLFANETIQRFRRLSKVMRLFIVLIVTGGLFVQMVGVLASPARFNGNIYGMVEQDENQFLFIPQLSGLSGNLDIIRTGLIDSFMTYFIRYFSPSLLFGIVVILVGILIFTIVRLWRLAGLEVSDVIRFKPLREFATAERTLICLVAANITLYALCSMIVSLTAIPRQVEIVFKDNTIERYSVRDRLLCIDEYGRVSGGDVKEVRVRWRGILWLPLNGKYTFYVKSLGRYLLEIDGKKIISNVDVKEQHTSSVKGSFKRGYHEFLVEYYTIDPERRLFHLYATFPGFGFYKGLITDRYVFPRRPSPLLEAGLFVDAFKFFFLILSGMIYCLVEARTTGSLPGAEIPRRSSREPSSR